MYLKIPKIPCILHIQNSQATGALYVKWPGLNLLLLTYMSALGGGGLFLVHCGFHPPLHSHPVGWGCVLWFAPNRGCASELLCPFILCLQPMLLSGLPRPTIDHLCHYFSCLLPAHAGLLKAPSQHTSVPLFSHTQLTLLASCLLLLLFSPENEGSMIL
jgi:hypothetical protein